MGCTFSSTAFAGLGLNRRNKLSNSIKRGRLSYGKGWRMLSAKDVGKHTSMSRSQDRIEGPHAQQGPRAGGRGRER
jgi:hypothetical protein